MKPGPEFATNSIPTAIPTGAARADVATAARRITPISAALIGAALIIALYFDAARAMVVIWSRSDTFAHGFLVVPASLWLAWRMRASLERTPARVFWPGLLLVLSSGLAWLAAELAGVASVAQLALVALLVSAIVTVCGWRIGLVAFFPLAFLFFAVPFGEFMVPWLMDRTADFTVAALRATGIPVFREGNFFVIPSGMWSVVEACSGIRYLIASLVGGALFAHLFYRSLRRKIAVLAASLIVPLIANWLRAYMIVMIGHLSGNTLAVDVDHLIYGWVFFGIVMFGFFWVASIWREDGDDSGVEARAFPSAVMRAVPTSNAGLIVALAVVIAAAGVWRPVYAWLDARGSQQPVTFSAPGGEAGWQTVDARSPPNTWSPTFAGPRATLDQRYAKSGAEVRVFVAAYRNQKQDSELVNSGNVLVSTEDARLRVAAESVRDVAWGRQTHAVRAVELRGDGESILVRSWYWIEGRAVTSDIRAKLLLAWQKLRARGDDSAAIVVSTRFATSDPAARVRAEQALDAFARDMGQTLEQELASMWAR